MKRKFTSRSAFPLASAIAALLASSTVHAGQTWDGTGADDNWNTAGNWDGDGLPDFANPITFVGNTRNGAANNLAADSVIGGINLTNDGTTDKTSAFTLSGNRITLGGDITTTASSSAIADTISLAMILDGNRTITTNTNRNLSIGGVVSETGGARTLVKNGAGTLTLNATNTYTGGTTVDQGTLALAAVGGATGYIRGTLTINSGGIVTPLFSGTGWGLGFSGAGSVNTININGGQLLFANNAGFGGTAASTINMTGGTIGGNGNGNAFDWYFGNTTTPFLNTLASASTATISAHLNLRLNGNGNALTFNVADGAAATDLLVRGNIVATGGNAGGRIVKTGTGTMTLSGANTYAGGTTISTGVLAVGQNNGGVGGDNINPEGTSTSLGGGAVNVAAGAALHINTAGLNIANNITLNGLSYGLNSGGPTATNNGPWNGALMGASKTGVVSNTFSGTITLNATSNVSTNWNDKTMIITGKVTGAGGLVIDNSAPANRRGSLVRLDNTTNDYAGDTTVNNGNTFTGTFQPTLILGASNVIPDGTGKGNLSVLGNLNLNGFSETVNGLGGSGVITSGVAGTPTLTVGNNNATGLTYSGIIQNGSGTVALVKTGTGTQTFSGVNTYTGGTTVDQGTLNLRGQGSAGNIRGTLTINSGGTVSPTLLGSTYWGLGFGAGTSVNTININGGALNFVGTAGLGGTAASTINMTGGTIGGSGGNTFDWYFGNTTTPFLNTLANASTATISAHLNLRLNGDGNALTFNVADGEAATDLLVSGNILASNTGDGRGRIIKTGTGTMTMTGAGTYAGGTTISGGILNVGTAGALSTGAVVNNATLNLTNTTAETTYTFGAVSGNGTINVSLGSGAGTTVLSTPTWASYAGTINIGVGQGAGSGKARLGANALPNTAAVNVTANSTLYTGFSGSVTHNAALSLGGGNTGESLGQLRFGANGMVWAGPVTLTGNVTGPGDYTIGVDGANTATISGNIGETGGAWNLSKGNTGKLILSGTNTYSGDTTVSAGTLYVTGALSNSAVTVEANGTIGRNGAANGGLGNGLTILAGGNLDLTGASMGANSTGILGIGSGTLTLGNLTFQDLVGWDWENAAPGTYELIEGGFTVNFGSTAYLSPETAYEFANGKKGYFTSGSLNAVIIPEPSAAALLGGLGMMLLLRRRR